MELFLIYVLPMLVNAFGIFGIWCTEPEGKFGIILTFLLMLIPGVNIISAVLFTIFAVYQAVETAPMFSKCKNFWKFLFGEDSIID
jgi:MFS-type transporter involved in bile tolerance (Atg22 family)